MSQQPPFSAGSTNIDLKRMPRYNLHLKLKGKKKMPNLSSDELFSRLSSIKSLELGQTSFSLALLETIIALVGTIQCPSNISWNILLKSKSNFRLLVVQDPAKSDFGEKFSLRKLVRFALFSTIIFYDVILFLFILLFIADTEWFIFGSVYHWCHLDTLAFCRQMIAYIQQVQNKFFSPTKENNLAF